MVLINMADRVSQMKEIHAESIDRELANCDFEKPALIGNNPIKCLKIIIELGSKLQKVIGGYK